MTGGLKDEETDEVQYRSAHFGLLDFSPAIFGLFFFPLRSRFIPELCSLWSLIYFFFYFLNPIMNASPTQAKGMSRTPEYPLACRWEKCAGAQQSSSNIDKQGNKRSQVVW